MIAQDSHSLGLTGQEIEVVVLKEPAKGIAIGITLQLDAPRKLVRGNDQMIVLNAYSEPGSRKGQTPFDVGQGIGAGQNLARRISERGKEDMLFAEGPDAGLVQLHYND